MSKNMGALTYPSIGDVGSRIPIFFSRLKVYPE